MVMCGRQNKGEERKLRKLNKRGQKFVDSSVQQVRLQSSSQATTCVQRYWNLENKPSKQKKTIKKYQIFKHEFQGIN